MIKKAGNILLALLVLCTTTGLVVSKHYSDGELYSVAIYNDAESCCDSEDSSMDSCHDVSAVYKVKDYFRTSASVTIQVQFNTIFHTAYINELFQISYEKDFNLFPELKWLKPKIPSKEFLQVFIL